MRFAPRLLLAFSSLCLVAGGAVHALAFPKAAIVADRSNLPAFFSGALKGLWLCDSITSVALAMAFGSIAAFPGMTSRSLVVLLALAPLAFAAAIFATMGNFFAGHLMLLAGTAALMGGALPWQNCTVPDRDSSFHASGSFQPGPHNRLTVAYPHVQLAGDHLSGAVVADYAEIAVGDGYGDRL